MENIMGYREALEAAGAEILAYSEFGTMQGDWCALVNYDGVSRWINGYFGSCSGCDAFSNEFDYVDTETQEYQEKLAAFGKTYIDAWFTQEEAERHASENIEWDKDARDMLDFIVEHKIAS
jgi:hypothetical protein